MSEEPLQGDVEGEGDDEVSEAHKEERAEVDKLRGGTGSARETNPGAVQYV
jgi:hypothetical protein